MGNENKTGRREFLMAVAGAPAAAALAGAAPAAPFNGIQMGSHTILDEGIERCLDFIQETAAINCVMPYINTYHKDVRMRPSLQAQDHGVPPRRMPGRKLPEVWVRHHAERFRDTSLRHQVVDGAFEYADRDLFAELREPTRKRGMKLYARVLEGMKRERPVENWEKVVTRDIYGKPTNVACWNHPEYKAWWAATVDDLFRSYDLDGLQWGAERMGPLINIILPWNNDPPTCFCEHCQARGRAKGIDPERARKGFEELYLYVQGLMAGKPKPPDGVFTCFLRVLLRFPEILAWEYQYRMAREEMEQLIYKTVKAVKPSAEVGWHIDHEPSSFDIIYRAEMSYAEMAPYADFIKPIMYHDILGPRIRDWYLGRFQKTILSEVSLEESLGVYYQLFGYDRRTEPKLEQLETTGFSPEYVYRETRRSVGIGFDVPWGQTHVPANPEKVYQCVRRALDAGAGGIVVSRDYEEMRAVNLRAVGRAIRQRG
jgi:hypothetical protein